MRNPSHRCANRLEGTEPRFLTQVAAAQRSRLGTESLAYVLLWYVPSSWPTIAEIATEILDEQIFDSEESSLSCASTGRTQ